MDFSKDDQLLNACKEGNLDLVKILVGSGANIEVKDEDTPLILASYYNHFEKGKYESRTYNPNSEEIIVKNIERNVERSKRISPKCDSPDIDEEKEIIVDIEDWPGCKISNMGRVFGNDGKEYKTYENKKTGKLKIQLAKKIGIKQYVRHMCAIDYLVMKYFLPEEEKYKVDDFLYEIIHVNENFMDNRYENLRIELKGKHPLSKNVNPGNEVLQYSKDGKFLGEYTSVLEAHNKTKVSVDNIKRVCKGDRKYGGEFIWKYKNGIPETKINLELWENIPGIPGYKISRDGRVWSEITNSLLVQTEKDGYMKVNLMINGKKTTKQVHLLVAKTYLPETDLFNPTIRHINTNTKDNNYYNLKWVSKTSKVDTKPVIQYDLEGNELARFNSIKKASISTGANQDTITMVCNGKRNKSGGYIWKWQ